MSVITCDLSHAIWNKYKALVNFSKTTKCTDALRACTLLLVFEKFTCAYLFQIALEIM